MLKKIKCGAQLGVTAILVHILANPILSENWFSDLWNHFRPLEILVLFSLAGFLLALKSLKMLISVALVSALGFWVYSKYEPLFGKDPYALSSYIPFERSDVGIQVISFNVYTPNKHFGDVTNWIETNLSKTRSNLVFLMETNDDWLNAVKVLKTRLPYSIEVSREDNFGAILLSDTPLNDVHQSKFDEHELPAFSGYIKDKKVRIAGIHTLPPLGNKGFEARNLYLKNLRTFVDKERIPTIIFGDFNCSPWSKNMKKFLLSQSQFEELNLQDSFVGIFRPHTWSAFGGIVSTAIDYILFTPHFVLKNSMIGPDLGSDHRPVVASF